MFCLKTLMKINLISFENTIDTIVKIIRYMNMHNPFGNINSIYEHKYKTFYSRYYRHNILLSFLRKTHYLNPVRKKVAKFIFTLSLITRLMVTMY